MRAWWARDRRRIWIAAAVAGALVWASFIVLSTADPGDVAASGDRPPSSTTTTRRATTTTRRLTTTTSTTTLPEPTAVTGVGADPTTTGGLSDQGASTFEVDALLAALVVAPESDPPGYDRDLFEHWIDADGDGCDTRAEVLMAESSQPVQTTAGCRVRSGWWLSIYDGYSTPDASELEVDHLVALHEAWQSGAAAWDPARRRAFANDLDHPGALVAVTAAMNRSKSDRDPASWQPPNRSAWCLYATDWIAVKVRWGLTADPAEVAALRNMLRGCGSAPVTAAPPATTTPLTSAAPPPPPPPLPPPPPPPAVGSCDPSYPGVCIPPAPPDLDCGDIPHRRFAVVPPDPHRFDGDHDGIGCEG